MAVVVPMKYVQHDPKTGSWTYRRRISDKLRPHFDGKREFKKLLGKSRGDALAIYGVVHSHFETLIANARNGDIPGKTPFALAEKYRALFEEWGYNPRGIARSLEEVVSRDASADRILEKYPQDKMTGHPTSPSILWEMAARKLSARF